MPLKTNCRLCAKHTQQNNIEIFGRIGRILNAYSVITSHFSINITINDKYSTIICEKCWEKLANFHSYFLKVQQVQKTIINSYIEKSTCFSTEKLTDIKSKENESNDNLPAISTAYADDRFDDEHYKSDHYHKTFKVESFDITDGKNKIERNNRIENDNSNENDDEQIRIWCNLECSMCTTETFHKFSDLRSHYRKEHKKNGFVTCCSKKYFRRVHLLDHIYKHINPNAFKCDICEKTFAGKKSITSHMKKHVPINQRPYKCEICSTRFALRSYLNLHVKSQHTTGNNVCDQCGKAYTSQATLRHHIKHVHENSGHICDICAKVFRRKETLTDHLLEHSNVKQPKIKCEICNLWYKTQSTLRKHRRRAHNANSLETVHKCNICGQLAPNDLALKAHKRHVHFTEKSHQCSICEKKFKVAIVLREHMATHTGESLYTCKFCPKQFNSGSNMFSHRKKVHRVQWEAEKLKRLAGQ